MYVTLAALVASRVVVWGVAIGGRLIWGRNNVNPTLYDLPQITQPFRSSTANLVAGVLARWDAVWYLLISTHGYVGPAGVPSPTGAGQWGASVNFLPGYPAAVRAASGFAATPELVVIAAYVLSFAAYGAALYFVYRLAEIEVGERAATWAVILLAIFPGALFFATPYAESVFLALSVGSFYAARTGRWRIACLLAAGAALTRIPGVLLVIPLALLRREREPKDGLAWLLLVPGALLAFIAYSWRLSGDALAYFHVGKAFHRTLMDPFTAFFHSAKAAVEGFGVIFLGTGSGPDPMPVAILDFSRFAVFVLAVLLTISALRNLRPAYGAYAAVSLLLMLCTGPTDRPLVSALRYLAVVFPLFIEAGRLATKQPRAALALSCVMAAGLAATTVQFARWWFVG